MASRMPLSTQGKELSGMINIPTRASVVNTCIRRRGSRKKRRMEDE